MLGKGRFQRGQIKRYEPLSLHSLKTGRVSPRQTEKLFKNRDDEAVPIRLWPHIFARKPAHSTAQKTGLPDVIAPIVTEAVLLRDGHIRPGRTLVPRDLLEPLGAGSFSIGTVESQDRYLAHCDYSTTGAVSAENWANYLEFCDALLTAVAGAPLADSTAFTEQRAGFFEAADIATAMTKGILALYDDLLSRENLPPLMRNYARLSPAPLSDGVPKPYALADRMGHANDQFSVAPDQRQVLARLAKAGDGEIIAVNGPPGTGKTTLLLSAIAGAWVKAAAAGGDPPVIIAASANNQAVTNIIDAFGKDYARGSGAFAGRWLPDINSFGMFLSSAAREAEASARYQTESVIRQLESPAYVAKARIAYLEKARTAFAEPFEAVTQVTARLQAMIKAKLALIQAVDTAHSTATQAQAALAKELGPSPDDTRSERRKWRDAAAQSVEKAQVLAEKWGQHVANESALLGVFSFLPPVARKRLAGAHNVFRAAGFGALADRLSRLADCRAAVKKLQQAAAEDLEAATKALARGAALIARNAAAQAHLATAISQISPRLAGAELDAIDRHMDCHIRFPLFLLATHYWEGRWLAEMDSLLPEIADEQKRTGKKSVVPRWYRRMMLTPCAVATFATLPSKMTCRAKRGSAFVNEYLYGFIDLLIIDEAGQVLPEVAAPSLALAKQALVVGDRQQIAPISNIQKMTDLGNLRKYGLAPADMDEPALSAQLSAGYLSHRGSAMACAQNATRTQPYPALDRGLYLFEHRRCVDEIIAFCNTLCYQGHLQPKRGPAPKTPLPPMGYLHIEGATFYAGGSRFNPAEARSIAAWLAAHRARLERQHGTRLEDIVAIVTPFGQQARALRQACASLGIRTQGNGAMTIGTVHALQGAERAIVLFSPVYTKGEDGGFIDASPSMLNVAVSRAKDHFLVFGDMDLFSRAPQSTPRGVLGRFLFSRPENALTFEMQPREDLVQKAAEIRMLRDADAHDIFLRDTLASARKSVEIVSPWIIKATMEKTGLLALMAQAVARGVEIDIYADPGLNTKPDPAGGSQFEAAAVALADIGVRLHGVQQLHSKIVSADADVFCIGSFNWLSADRAGRYARHETSLVYSGAQMAGEIERFRQNLDLRVA